ncbi:MAG: hypothetical protein IK096_07245, partial [Lachnospiraceae bacterium]|nr:hypothetical protein [Lachnospiraceae bacterium]
MNRRSIGIMAILFVLLAAAGVVYQAVTREPAAVKDDTMTVLMPGIEISALYDDGARVWAGTNEGIYLLDRDTGEITEQVDADIHMIFSAMITQTDDGLIWAGHEDGLSAFDREL